MAIPLKHNGKVSGVDVPLVARLLRVPQEALELRDTNLKGCHHVHAPLARDRVFPAPKCSRMGG